MCIDAEMLKRCLKKLAVSCEMIFNFNFLCEV